jgi:hypothetical protein
MLTMTILASACCVCYHQDAMGVARNITLEPRLVPGGGAVEMAVSRALSCEEEKSSARSRMQQPSPYIVPLND